MGQIAIVTVSLATLIFHLFAKLAIILGNMMLSFKRIIALNAMKMSIEPSKVDLFVIVKLDILDTFKSAILAIIPSNYYSQLYLFIFMNAL